MRKPMHICCIQSRKYGSSAFASVLAKKPNVVVVGDSRDKNPYHGLALNGSAKADILVTDPPYCILTRRQKYGDPRQLKSNSREAKVKDLSPVQRFENLAEYRSFTSKWLTNCITLALKPTAPLIIWSNPLGKEVIVEVASTFGFELLGEYIWAKPTKHSGNAPQKSSKNEVMYRVCETALILCKTETISFKVKKDSLPWSVVTGYPNRGIAEEAEEVISITGNTGNAPISNLGSFPGDSKQYQMDTSDQLQSSLIPSMEYKDTRSSLTSSRSPPPPPHHHPYHKPFSVLKPLMTTWTKPNDVILDPFLGSGGIAQAANRLGEGRAVYGIEIDAFWAKHCADLLGNDTSL